MKFIFFILVSLNAVLFFWEYSGPKDSVQISDEALRQMDDRSVERIALPGEPSGQNGHSHVVGPRTDSAESFYLTEPGSLGISKSVDQRMSELIQRQSNGLVTELLQSEIKSAIAVSRTVAADRLGVLYDTEGYGDNVGMCCPGVPMRANFPSFDQSFGITTEVSELGVSDGDRNREGVPFAQETARSTSSPTVGFDGKPTGGIDQLCYKLGPRASRRDFSRITGFFEEAGMHPAVRPESVDVETGFMVYYPAGDSFEASRANVRLLREKGLKDIWLINRGAMRGNISLGILKTRERAENLLTRLEARGISPKIQAKFSKKNLYFLSVSLPTVTESLSTRLAELGFEPAELKTVDPENCGSRSEAAVARSPVE